MPCSRPAGSQRRTHLHSCKPAGAENGDVRTSEPQTKEELQQWLRQWLRQLIPRVKACFSCIDSASPKKGRHSGRASTQRLTPHLTVRLKALMRPRQFSAGRKRIPQLMYVPRFDFLNGVSCFRCPRSSLRSCQTSTSKPKTETVGLTSSIGVGCCIVFGKRRSYKGYKGSRSTNLIKDAVKGLPLQSRSSFSQQVFQPATTSSC